MRKVLVLLAAFLATIATVAVASDYYNASGIPVQRSTISSAEFRTEFANIETGISDKLPALTGNGDKVVVVNSGGTALTVATTGVPVAGGGTGSTTASGARTNLGLAIGTDVQAWDAQLDDIAALAVTDGNFIVGDGANWVAESGATARASMGANDAANLSTGELADARLSANVPLLDQINTFTAALTIQSTTGDLSLWSTSAGADEKRWTTRANSTGTWSLFTVPDAGGGGSNAIQVLRTGTTVDEIQLDATTLDFNGNADVSGTFTHAGDAVVSETSGSFSVDFDDACTTTPSYTWYYVKQGNVVTINPGSFGAACTSDSIYFRDTSAPIPVALRPTASQVSAAAVTYNDSTTGQGCVNIESDGDVAIVLTGGTQCNLGWSATGQKGVWIGSFSYILTN